MIGDPVRASQDISAKCDDAAQIAAEKTGVPLSVLKAISLNETGRKREGQMRPWPWTVNMEGAGVWFETEEEARSYVAQNFKRGARSFDVGCFQINFRWHGKAFASIDDMFDPQLNAVYAAEFLKDLHAEKGNWPEAAGAYHSRTKEYADRYSARFEATLAKLAQQGTQMSVQISGRASIEPAANAIVPVKERTNSFPLLVAARNRQTLGSLVPIYHDARPRRLFDEPEKVDR